MRFVLLQNTFELNNMLTHAGDLNKKKQAKNGVI